VPVVNVKGIQAGQTAFGRRHGGQHLLGDITQWDDPQIKRLNPKLTVGRAPRSRRLPVDGSGTNFLFSEYSPKTSPKFLSSIGANTSVQWPTGIGAKVTRASPT